MLLSAPKKHKPSEVKEARKRVPVRLNQSLVDEMSKFHSPKEKSQWVSDAVLDLLSREIYHDADWQDTDNEDTVAFLSLLNFGEKLVDPVADTILMEQSVVDAMSEAVKNICWAAPEVSRSVRPAIIRAAIRQRIVLNGKLLNQILKKES